MPRPDPSPSPRILVVDDDPDIRELLSGYLRQARFDVDTAEDGVAMWARMEAACPDLVILDLMLPGEDGLSLCQALRERTAIIILTAQGATVDRVVGLELGADDYVAKPFDPRELLARIKAVLRRARPTPPADEPTQIRFAGWTLDLRARHMLSPEGLVVSLPGSDFQVLRLLLAHPHQPLSRDFLMQRVFGRERGPMDRSVDVCISRLRQHLEHDSRRPELIRTVRHEGYVLFTEPEPVP